VHGTVVPDPRLVDAGRFDLAALENGGAEVGTRTRCTLTGAGLDGRYGVTVTVATVEDGEARFDVEVDTEPLG
jgi:hypothetical protein